MPTSATTSTREYGVQVDRLQPTIARMESLSQDALSTPRLEAPFYGTWDTAFHYLNEQLIIVDGLPLDSLSIIPQRSFVNSDKGHTNRSTAETEEVTSTSRTTRSMAASSGVEFVDAGSGTSTSSSSPSSHGEPNRTDPDTMSQTALVDETSLRQTSSQDSSSNHRSGSAETMDSQTTQSDGYTDEKNNHRRIPDFSLFFHGHGNNKPFYPLAYIESKPFPSSFQLDTLFDDQFSQLAGLEPWELAILQEAVLETKGQVHQQAGCILSEYEDLEVLRCFITIGLHFYHCVMTKGMILGTEPSPLDSNDLATIDLHFLFDPTASPWSAINPKLREAWEMMTCGTLWQPRPKGQKPIRRGGGRISTTIVYDLLPVDAGYPPRDAGDSPPRESSESEEGDENDEEAPDAQDQPMALLLSDQDVQPHPQKRRRALSLPENADGSYSKKRRVGTDDDAGKRFARGPDPEQGGSKSRNGDSTC